MQCVRIDSIKEKCWDIRSPEGSVRTLLILAATVKEYVVHCMTDLYNGCLPGQFDSYYTRSIIYQHEEIER